uniref:Lipoprotein n=1 Tax=Bosea sp. NBC_00436 TaxID=2969620 RepID=A0A9E7ZL17_9HYPH
MIELARFQDIRWSTVGAVACGVVLPFLLAGCGGGESLPPIAGGGAAGASAPAPANVSRDALVGRWGVASFHTEKDRKRTEAEARSQCKQPYVIAKGSGDGVMMHVADDPKLYELRLKAGPGGKTYLGFEAPAGDPQDRELLSVKPKEFVARFVDPDANARYGTFIYSRCG